mgnify:CR=1 FL=1
MITGSCHCGAVSFEYDAEPSHLTSCNCSLCRRLGGLMAYAPLDQVRVHHAPDAVIDYIQGDRTLAFVTCRTCGCTTHYTPTDPAVTRMKVNLAMADPQAIAGFRIRHFDGANTWRYLDEAD